MICLGHNLIVSAAVLGFLAKLTFILFAKAGFHVYNSKNDGPTSLITFVRVYPMYSYNFPNFGTFTYFLTKKNEVELYTVGDYSSIGIGEKSEMLLIP